MASDGSGPPEVDRGPQPTQQPSRVAMVLVGLGVAVVMGLLVVAGGATPDRLLDEGETMLEQGTHTIAAGPARITTDLTGGDWIERQRCDRWTQLWDAGDDANTLHLVWMDAVPEPSTVGDVQMVPAPADIAGYWREAMDLEVTELDRTPVDGRPAVRYRLGETEDSRRADGLLACGEAGGIAAIGLLGPAARFEQEVVLVDVEGTTLAIVAAAYVGGDIERVSEALDGVVSSASITVEDDPGA